MRIDLLPTDLDDKYFFQISNAAKIFLTSNTSLDKASCLKLLEDVLRNLRDSQQISILSEHHHQYYFEVLRQAKSPTFDDIEAASDVLVKLKEFAKSDIDFQVNYQIKGDRIISKKQIGFEAEQYNFDRISKSKKAGFELIETTKSERYFHFNDAAGKAVFYSRIFDGNRRRIKAILDLIKNGENDKRFQMVQQNDGHYFIFLTKEGYEIGRSRYFDTNQQMEAAIDFLKKQVVGEKEAFILPKKKKKKITEKYNLTQKAPLGQLGFEAFKNKKSKLHYFHFHDKHGLVLIYSKPYDQRKIRDAAIKDVLMKGSKKKAYKVWKKSKQEYYFSIIDKKGKSFARSRYFKTEAEMQASFDQFRTSIVNIKQEVNVVPTIQEEQLTINLERKKSKGFVKTEKTGNTFPIAKAVTMEKSTKKEPKYPENEVPAAAKEPKQAKERKIDNTLKPIEKEPIKGIKIETDPPIESVSSKVKTQPTISKVYKPKNPTKPILEKSTAGVSYWKWVLLGLIGLALAAMIFRTCNKKAPQKVIQPPTPAPKIVETVKPEPLIIEKLGPTALEMNLTANTAEARLADFLSKKKVTLPRIFILESVQFPFSSLELTSTSFTQLNKIITVLNSYPNAKIEINGHTDSLGDDAKNIILSENRAITVKNYLLSKGISSERVLKATGYGESEPIATNETEIGRQENRRSELVVVER